MSGYGYGRGYGRGMGKGRGSGKGGGRGGMRRRGMGPRGYCICLRCGYRVPKQPGVRCMEMRCPNCGAVMIREGSEHHRFYMERKRGGP